MRKSETLERLQMSLMATQRTIAACMKDMTNNDKESIPLLMEKEKFIKEMLARTNNSFPNEKQEESLYVFETPKEVVKDDSDSPKPSRFYGGVFGVGQ